MPTEAGGVYHHALVLNDPDAHTSAFRLIHYVTSGVCITPSAEDSLAGLLD